MAIKGATSKSVNKNLSPTPPETPPVEDVPEVLITTDSISTKTDDDQIGTKLSLMNEKLILATNVIKELSSTIKIVQKDYMKMKKLHAAALVVAQGSRKNGRAKKAGQSKPPCQGHISVAMSDFLGVPHDHMMSRRDVINGLNSYIKEKSLQSPKDGRIIIPDDRLKTLLSIPDNIDLTYFNMQKYINPHFTPAKQVVDIATPTTSTN